MTPTIPICFNCKYYSNTKVPSCWAYIDKIPKEIFFNEVEHDKPRPDQFGDFVFTPID